MGILDNILQNIKNNGINSVQVNNITGEEIEKPMVPVVDKDVTTQENVESKQSEAQPEVKYPDKPQGLNDQEYEHLLKYYAPEAISKYSAPYDPSSNGNYLSRIYESSMPKPSSPDEKTIKRNRVLAGVADGISMLSQMYSAGKGAYMRERDYKQSAIAQQTEQERNLRNVYQQQANRYNDGLFNARLKDFLQGLEEYNNGRKGIQGVLAQKQKLDEAAKQAENKMRFNYDKLAQDQANKDADRKIKEDSQKSLDRYRKAMEAQGWSRVADSKNRTSAYVKKMSSSGTGKNSNYQMIFGANPNDSSDVQTDNFGNKVKVFEMNKGQIDQYAREALSDPEFMARHKDLIIQKPDMLGSGSYKYKPNQDIAAAYLQEQYENSFTQLPSIPSTATQPLVNWGQSQSWMPSLDEEDATPEEMEEGDNDGWSWID